MSYVDEVPIPSSLVLDVLSATTPFLSVGSIWKVFRNDSLQVASQSAPVPACPALGCAGTHVSPCPCVPSVCALEKQAEWEAQENLIDTSSFKLMHV